MTKLLISVKLSDSNFIKNLQVSVKATIVFDQVAEDLKSAIFLLTNKQTEVKLFASYFRQVTTNAERKKDFEAQIADFKSVKTF